MSFPKACADLSSQRHHLSSEGTTKLELKIDDSMFAQDGPSFLLEYCGLVRFCLLEQKINSTAVKVKPLE